MRRSIWGLADNSKTWEESLSASYRSQTEKKNDLKQSATHSSDSASTDNFTISQDQNIQILDSIGVAKCCLGWVGNSCESSTCNREVRERLHGDSQEAENLELVIYLQNNLRLTCTGGKEQPTDSRVVKSIISVEDSRGLSQKWGTAKTMRSMMMMT